MLLTLVACGGEPKKDDEDPKNKITFTEMVAIDNEECSIKLTGIDPDNTWGYTINALLENKSADKTYTFSVEYASINGVQADPFFASIVAAGKQSNEEITFLDIMFEQRGITEYTDIELTFNVYDTNDWTADAVAIETIHIYPYGKDKATKFVREPQSTDNVIIDNDYVTGIVIGYEMDDTWEYEVNLFLLNKTDKNIMFSVEEASVNGYMADPYYAVLLYAGKCAFTYISWSTTTLEDNNITEIETIEFKLQANDFDDGSSDDFVNETITLKP